MDYEMRRVKGEKGGRRDGRKGGGLYLELRLVQKEA